MRYVEARIDQYSRDEAYRIYISKSLQLNPQNKWLERDLQDIFHPETTDTRTGDEIAIDVIAKAGLHFFEE